jgi:hypothetical protein
MQRDIEAQQQSHVFEIEELKREMIADVGMLQATHMQEMSVAHERALAAAASNCVEPLSADTKVSFQLISSGLIRIKHSCSLARASCKIAADGMRALTKEISSGLSCADDAFCLMQQQWQHEQHYWKQRLDVQISGHILSESVDMLQQQHHQQDVQQQQQQQQEETRHHQQQSHNDHEQLLQQQFPVSNQEHHQQFDHLQQQQQQHQHHQHQEQNLEHLRYQQQHQQHHPLHQDQHFKSQLFVQGHSSPQLIESGAHAFQVDNSTSNGRQSSRHVRFTLADGTYQPGISPAAPHLPTSNDGRFNTLGQVTDVRVLRGETSTGVLDKKSQQEEDSLDEGSGGEGVGSLQSYLHDGRVEDTSGNADDGVKFATLWPPHELSTLPPASAATLSLMMQPHSPSTIAHQLIAQARGVSASMSRNKMSPADSSRSSSSSASFSPSKSTAGSSQQSSDDVACAEEELRTRELYGDYVWIVQKTQASDDIGGSIQVRFSVQSYRKCLETLAKSSFVWLLWAPGRK